jgi:hypothetical protein
MGLARKSCWAVVKNAADVRFKVNFIVVIIIC